MFHGTRPVTIDSKGRAAIPTSFREPLGAASGSKLVLTLSLHSNGCLWVYPRYFWEQISDKVSKLSDTSPQNRLAKLRLISMAELVEPDANWRILIPSEQRDAAALEREARFVGSGTRYEIWNIQALATARGDSAESLDVYEASEELKNISF